MQTHVIVGEYYQENQMSTVFLQMKSLQSHSHDVKENCRGMEWKLILSSSIYQHEVKANALKCFKMLHLKVDLVKLSNVNH